MRLANCRRCHPVESGVPRRRPAPRSRRTQTRTTIKGQFLLELREEATSALTLGLRWPHPLRDGCQSESPESLNLFAFSLCLDPCTIPLCSFYALKWAFLIFALFLLRTDCSFALCHPNHLHSLQSCDVIANYEEAPTYNLTANSPQINIFLFLSNQKSQSTARPVEASSDPICQTQKTLLLTTTKQRSF